MGLRWRVVALALLLGACAQPPAVAPQVLPSSTAAPAAPASPPQPESASGWSPKPGWTSAHFMVAAANPLATEAGYGILRAGGSAIDATIAVQLVLALVEPQSSGLGGGAFLLHWDGHTVQAWDGRETAPAAANETIFLRANGQPLPFGEAVFGGRAVATPGVVKMLEAAHRVHGSLPWARLFDPAIALAEGGFAISPRLHGLLESDPLLRQDAQARAYFYAADGTPYPVGHQLRNPALAAVLRAVAQRGSSAFYAGPVADDMVARVRGHRVPGGLRSADLAAYTPRMREPLCTLWRSIYRVCGMGPPSSGHIAIMQMLGMLERAPQVDPALVRGVPGAAWLHAYTEATRLAFADRAQYVADPDFVSAPGGDWHSLLAGAYLAQRAALIGPLRLPSVAAGQPAAPPVAHAPMPDQPEHGTSHISVVDGQGRAVAMTTSIESAFGARLMADGGTGLAGGFLLNNEMTDFSFTPTDAAGRPVANRVQPGKRPRSSMSPTLVFDARSSETPYGRLLMTLGSPGGPVIIHFTAKTLIGTLQWGLNAQRAIDLPNFGAVGDPTSGPLLLERGMFPPATVQALRALGHTVVETELTSGLQAIERSPAPGLGWFGGADPRREGIVRGD